MVSKLVVWSNGMVMCFDEHGQQMPGFQGPINEVLERALDQVKRDGGECEIGDWKSGTVATKELSLRCLLDCVKQGGE